MIRSMTGFGAAEGLVGASKVSVELRSVNHRFFNPSIKLPSALAKWEGEVREALRKSVGRGHVTLTAWVDREASAEGLINEERFAAYVARLRELKQKHSLEGPIDLATVLRLPDVVGMPSEDESGDAGQLVAIVEKAATALAASRDAEGKRLGGVLADRIKVVEASV